MEYLKVDKQTIHDLSIFTPSGQRSVFEIYNKTSTQGGTEKLKEIFQHPLVNENEINARSGILQFFSKTNYEFPLDAETIALIDFYLENDDVRSQLGQDGQSIFQRLKDKVSTAADFTFVHDGVQAVLRLFSKLRQFVSLVKSSVVGSVYESSYRRLVDLLDSLVSIDLSKNNRTQFETKLSNTELAALDKNLRFDRREQMLQMLDLLYQLDVFITVGKIARTCNFHFATALPKQPGIIEFEQLVHPLLENAIGNDISLSGDKNILFLTGANMAGKSTLMKSVGIALYLGHMGFPVAADQFKFSVKDGIYTSINLADNLAAGASHYYAEVLRIKDVAIALNERKEIFVIFDELFRGTNVKDAHDATIALTRAFSRKRGSQFIISTHIMEAGELLQKESLSIQFQFLPTEMNGNKPIYTRKLKNGITADRQGMIIIQNEGILDMLDKGIKKDENDIPYR